MATIPDKRTVLGRYGWLIAECEDIMARPGPGHDGDEADLDSELAHAFARALYGRRESPRDYEAAEALMKLAAVAYVQGLALAGWDEEEGAGDYAFAARD